MNMKKDQERIKSLLKLPQSFYVRNDVVQVAKELLGKILVTHFENKITAGRIVETEAYNGPYDQASHAYNNRRTKRTEVMSAYGGVAYVYLCYGIHQMFNVVTNEKDVPNAVLIRAVEPIIGMDIMLERSAKNIHGYDLTKGPGNVAKSFGLHTSHAGISLLSDEIFIASDNYEIEQNEIMATERIGVGYAQEDALLPYRFIVKGNPYVSGKRSLNTCNGKSMPFSLAKCRHG